MTATAGRPAEPHARLAARLQVVLHHTDALGDPAPLRVLHREAAAALGDSAPLTLLVECALQETLSLARPAVESRSAWRAAEPGRRRAGAGGHHVDEHPAYENRYERRSGDRHGRDGAPDRYQAEWSQRSDTLGPDDYRTRIARANFAFALRQRGRDADLAEADRLLRARRSPTGPAPRPDSNPFTWQARGLLALTLMDSGRTRWANADPAHAAVTLATGLMEARRRRLGRFHVRTLRAHLFGGQR